MIEVDQRSGAAGDRNFILSTWLKSYRKTQDNKRMVNDVYYPNQTNTIERTLKQAKVLIQVNPQDANHIYSYIIYESTNNALILHFAYTKRTFRRFGLFDKALESLLNEGKEIVVATHANDMFDLLEGKYGLIYNPYMRG